MNFVDTTLVRLADSTTRAAVFDDAALQQMLAATYDTDAMPVEGPFQSIFDDFRLGLAVLPQTLVDGTWNPIGGMERFEAHYSLAGLGDGQVARVDAVWLGHISAVSTTDRAHITSVSVNWPDLGSIDAQIRSELGALPNDPTVLEQQRRSHLLAALRQHADQPNALTDAGLSALLADMQVGSVGDLLEASRGLSLPASIRVSFSPPDAPDPVARMLPIAAAILIRDTGLSIAQLITDTRMVREQLQPLGLDRPSNPDLPVRQPFIVAWAIPAALFDDADWPGAVGGMTPDQARAARRMQAGAWLAGEGIGLIAIS